MPTIRCAACGKHYDYRQEGCCPRCGAYNLSLIHISEPTRPY